MWCSRYPKSLNGLRVLEGKATLVHCNAGASRSGAISIAWIMHAKGLSFDESIKFAKDLRKEICPNSHFQLELQSFDFSTIRKWLINKTRAITCWVQRTNGPGPRSPTNKVGDWLVLTHLLGLGFHALALSLMKSNSAAQFVFTIVTSNLSLSD